jgi:hypothetical protein
MNGRTAQESQLPVNGSAATNGHVPQSDPHSTEEQSDENKTAPPSDEKPSDEKPSNEKPPETPKWVEEYVARNGKRVTNGTALPEFDTPVRVDEIAVAAMALSENLKAATRDMPESDALRAFRRELDEAADTFREVAGELETTAGNLVRLAAHEGRACGIGWGVCPEHGLTLMNVGETVTCHVLGCYRENEGTVERCEQPVAYKVVDAAGPALMTCAGHAIACRLHLENPVITLASDSLELF